MAIATLQVKSFGQRLQFGIPRGEILTIWWDPKDFTEIKISPEEKEEIDNVEIHAEGKTKSQRLRNVLFVLHNQTHREPNQEHKDFKEFYTDEMEKIREHYKSKLK